MIASPGGGDAIGVDSLEAWLIQIGCQKKTCPTRFVCMWEAPNGWNFTAPNPEYCYLVPESFRARLGEIIKQIMAREPNLDD